MKKILSFILIMFLFITRVNAGYTADKGRSTLRGGEVIYFDTTGLGWQHVYIHLWEKDGDVYKDWGSNDEMTKVDGTDNIYKFVVPDDIEEKYNMIIFHNEYGGNDNQTIDLSHIEEKYAYLVTGYSDGKRIGHWYLYDKSGIEARLEELKAYQNDKDYYTTDSYANLDTLISNIEQALTERIDLEQDLSNPDLYSIAIDFIFGDAEDIIDALVVNTDLLSNLIEEEKAKYSDYEKNYTKGSVDNLKKVINTQEALLNNPNISVDDIKNGISAINTAKRALSTQADKKELIKQLDIISKLNKDKYTEESYKGVSDLLESANNILDDTNVSQADVDEMVEKLKSAINNLKEKVLLSEEKVVSNPNTVDNIDKIIIYLGLSITTLIIIIYMLKNNHKIIKG